MKKLWIKFTATQFWQTHKEELIIIPLFIVGFYLVNGLLSWAFPNSAFFDFFSQIETIIYRGVNFIVAIAIAWFALRVFFPPIYRYLSTDFYNNFVNLSADTKLKYGIAFLLVFILSICLLSGARGAGNNDELRAKLLKVLSTQLNVRETTYNRGPEVDYYNRSVGAPMSSSWCGAFVGTNLTNLGIKNPNSAWSPAYANPKDVIWTPKKPAIKPLAGDVPTFYNSHLKRVGHVGFFLREDKSGYFITEEGNTNNNGSFNGDGVYLKKRDPGKIHAIARYIK